MLNLSSLHATPVISIKFGNDFWAFGFKSQLHQNWAPEVIACVARSERPVRPLVLLRPPCLGFCGHASLVPDTDVAPYSPEERGYRTARHVLSLCHSILMRISLCFILGIMIRAILVQTVKKFLRFPSCLGLNMYGCVVALRFWCIHCGMHIYTSTSCGNGFTEITTWFFTRLLPPQL